MKWFTKPRPFFFHLFEHVPCSFISLGYCQYFENGSRKPKLHLQFKFPDVIFVPKSNEAVIAIGVNLGKKIQYAGKVYYCNHEVYYTIYCRCRNTHMGHMRQRENDLLFVYVGELIKQSASLDSCQSAVRQYLAYWFERRKRERHGFHLQRFLWVLSDVCWVVIAWNEMSQYIFQSHHTHHLASLFYSCALQSCHWSHHRHRKWSKKKKNHYTYFTLYCASLRRSQTPGIQLYTWDVKLKEIDSSVWLTEPLLQFIYWLKIYCSQKCFVKIAENINIV